MKENNPKFDPKVLSDFKDYASSSDKSRFGVWDYLNGRADFSLAAAFSKLFYPEFIVVDGCVLLAEHYDPLNFQEWKNKLNGDGKRIESIINHVHVHDLFLRANDRTSDPSIYEVIGTTMKKCWRCALSEAFPQKKFKITYGTEPDEYGPTLTFYQE